jgi:hypothetical protein
MDEKAIEEGKALLRRAGPMQIVAAVMGGEGDKVGCTLKNKAQGNITYGYFDDEDDEGEETSAIALIVWLLNYAHELIAIADVAVEANIHAPALDLSHPPRKE